MLQNAWFVVRTAADRFAALIAAYEMRPGVIVIDVSMPALVSPDEIRTRTQAVWDDIPGHA